MSCWACACRLARRRRPPIAAAQPIRPLRLLAPALCLLVVLAAFAPPAPAASLHAVADPPRLRADHASTSIIIVQVRDDSGSPAGDGTLVNFTTTLGSITPTAETRGGVARAVLTSGFSVGTAVVSVMAAGVRAEMEVEFTADGGSAQGTAAVMSLEGKEVTYNPEDGLASVGEAGKFNFGAVTLQADDIQCDFRGSSLTAQGRVEISDGKQTISGDAVAYSPQRGRGSLLRNEGEATTVYAFSLPGLQLVPEPNPDLEQFRPPEESPSRTLISARRVQTSPDGQTVFDNATILLDGVKLISLPHYALDPSRGDQGLVEQAVTLNRGMGLTADFPYYYIAQPGRIGELRITHNLSPEGGLTDRGWGLDLEERYSSGGGRGTLNLDDLMGDTQGLRWTHSQKLGPGFQAFASVRYTRTEATSPRMLDASATASKLFPGFALDLALRASDYADTGNYSAALSARTHARPIGASGFSFAAGLRLNCALGTIAGSLPTTGQGESDSANLDRRAALTETLSLNLNSPQWKLSSKTSLGSTLSLANSWSSSSTGQSLGLSASLRHSLGQVGQVGLNYNGSLFRGGSVNSDRHSLSLNLSATRRNLWNASGFASYELTTGSIFGSGSLRYFLPFQRSEDGAPRWALSLSGSMSRWTSALTTDFRAGLARAIGNWEVTLNYSPHGSDFGSGFLGGSTGLLGMSGYGYIQELGSTLWLEIGPRSF